MTLKNPPTNTTYKDIDIENLIAYRKRGLSLTEIAKIEGCSHQNVGERLKKANLEGLANFREYKDTKLEVVQRDIINSLHADDIKDMSGLQKITGAAILQDKIMALRGQSGIVVEHRHIIADLRDAQDRLRKAGVVIDIGSDELNHQ
jgi:predicted DNA-binding protein YlxM (UPF0122 family)